MVRDHPDKGTNSKIIKWIGKDEKSLKKFESAFLPQVGKKTSFKKCMDKMKTTLNSTMRKRKKIKVGGKGKNIMLAAEWVDDELIKNIKLRTYYSREWKIARKNKSSPEIIEQCKRRYMKQQYITSTMTGNKKSLWEKRKLKKHGKMERNFGR